MKKIKLFDTPLLSGTDLAKSLSKLTNTSYENAIIKLNSHETPTISDNLGNIDMQAFRNLARSHNISDSSTAKELSSLTGRSFENVLHDMNMIKVTPFKK